MRNNPPIFPAAIYQRKAGGKSDDLIFIEEIKNLEEWNDYCEREERKEK